jgi:hypothetical protein
LVTTIVVAGESLCGPDFNLLVTPESMVYLPVIKKYPNVVSANIGVGFGRSLLQSRLLDAVGNPACST